MIPHSKMSPERRADRAKHNIIQTRREATIVGSIAVAIVAFLVLAFLNVFNIGRILVDVVEWILGVIVTAILWIVVPLPWLVMILFGKK